MVSCGVLVDGDVCVLDVLEPLCVVVCDFLCRDVFACGGWVVLPPPVELLVVERVVRRGVDTDVFWLCGGRDEFGPPCRPDEGSGVGGVGVSGEVAVVKISSQVWLMTGMPSKRSGRVRALTTSALVISSGRLEKEMSPGLRGKGSLKMRSS